jgi:hypothetical protein
MTVSAQDTINKIRDAYDKLKDKTFGAVFSRFAAESKARASFCGQSRSASARSVVGDSVFRQKEKMAFSFKVPHGSIIKISCI